MEAYITEIKIYDDIENLVATLVHVVDSEYSVVLANQFTSSKELRFIADCLEDNMLTEYTKQGEKKNDNKI